MNTGKKWTFFLMIENVYVTLKLKFKSCVLFILSNIWRRIWKVIFADYQKLGGK